jgi:hypothetical protein
MIATRLSRTVLHGLLGGGALCIAFSLPAAAQVQTTTTETKGEAAKTVKVERGEVVYVSGNDVIIRAEDGTLRHFNNVPDSVTVTVDGKQLNVHQIKPGMKIEKQTITTTTPKMITTIDCDGQSLAGHATSVRHPHARKRQKPDVQDPQWPKVHD